MASMYREMAIKKAILPFVLYFLHLRGFLFEIDEGSKATEECAAVTCPLSTVKGPTGEMETVQTIAKPTARTDFLPDTFDFSGIVRFLCQIPDCWSSPCENSGTCKEIDTGFSCSCTPAYTGERCHQVNPECYTDTSGADYRGFVNTTVNGRVCMKWSVQSPHSHTRTPINYPNSGLGDHNYCRNPDGTSRVWCYTIDPYIRFEFCDSGKPADECQ